MSWFSKEAPPLRATLFRELPGVGLGWLFCFLRRGRSNIITRTCMCEVGGMGVSCPRPYILHTATTHAWNSEILILRVRYGRSAASK